MIILLKINITQTRIMASDVQTPIHNYFDRNDQRTPVQYSKDQNRQMTHNLKEFQTSKCLMNDNSSKQMFASGA